MLEYTARGGLLYVEGAADFDLADTLESGQCFRWRVLPDGFYEVRAGRKRAEFKQERELLIGRFVAATEFDSFWRNYFDLDYDYAAVKQILRADPVMERAVAFCGGIHLLRQDCFEALICFIISQNNNIPRIKQIVSALCEAYGDGGFPTAERLATLDIPDLACIRAGFRVKYILDAAKKVAAGEIDLSRLGELPYPDAEKELLKISGVGTKVAACTLLFGARQLNAFPEDVWIKKAVAHFYPDGFDKSICGGYAGIAQQYLYHYARVAGIDWKE